MNHESPVAEKSLPNRLAWAVPLGLMAIGAGSLIEKNLSAKAFGIEAPEGPALAYFYAAGTRDVILGLMLFQWMRKASDKDKAFVIALISFIPFSDGALVLHYQGVSKNLLLHFGSGILALSLAFLLKSERTMQSSSVLARGTNKSTSRP